MKTRLAVLVLVLSFAALMGCTHLQTKVADDGTVFHFAGRTGVFGVDTGVVLARVPQPDVLVPVSTPAPTPTPRKIERTTTRITKSWDGCNDPTPNKNARNFKEQAKIIRKDILYTPSNKPPVQPQQQMVRVPQAPKDYFYAGSNPSVGNIAVPALIGATGFYAGMSALRPSETNINQVGGGANQTQGQIQSQRQIQSQKMWQKQTATGGNATANSSTNTDIGVSIRN